MNPLQTSSFGVRAKSRDGFALLAVLLVLLALFVLAVPFLWSAGEADRAAVRASDRSFLRLSLEDAARHARSRLWETQTTFDRTRDFDSLAEIDVQPDLDSEFYTGGGQNGLPWDHEVRDLAARIDWNSASPQLVANAIGQATYLLKPVGAEGEVFEVARTTGFPESCYVFCDREIVQVRREQGSNRLRVVERGVGSQGGDCGPSLPEPHSAGAPVLGLDAIAFSLWRASRGEDEIRAFDTGGLARELAAFLPSGLSPETTGSVEEAAGPAPLDELLETLGERGTLWGGIGAGPRWQRPVRIAQALLGGNTCTFAVQESRWFAPGTTVLIEGGGNREFGLVVEAAAGRVRLLDSVVNDYSQLEAQISASSRRPVNLNTAEKDTLVVLFENLKLRGRNERVTRSEALQFAELCLEARPFTGFEDWLERVLLPAGGLRLSAEDDDSPTGSRPADSTETGGFLEREDVIALYANAYGSGDVALEFSTAPLTFTTRDVYSLDLRAVRTAPNGLERARGRIEQLEVVLPPSQLLALWDRQIDFEENQRLFGRMPGWLSGPEAVYVPDLDGGAASPPRRRAHLSIDEGSTASEAPQVLSQFPAATELGYFQPAPERTDEAGQRQGRVFHFDRSRSSVEGENLAQGGGVAFDALDPRVGWQTAGEFPLPMALSFWARLAGGADGTLFDAGSALAGDRLHVRTNGGRLEVRVHDGPGDHPATAFEEVGQASFPLDGTGGGPAAGDWFHLNLDVRGNRPDQIGVRIDGFAHTGANAAMRVDRRGLTHLTSSLADGQAEISVESTEGFPERCVLRIGDELIEAVRGTNSFDATPILTGEAAGFGGRLAREHHTQSGTLNGGLSKNASYAAGTPVSLYGYSLDLQSAAPGGGSSLQSELGPFAVARVAGFNGGGLGGEILLQTPNGQTPSLGRGFDSAVDNVQSLEVEHADSASGGTRADALAAFSSSGGYAILMQQSRTWTVGPGEDDEQLVDDPHTPEGSKLFGLSVIRYSGKTARSVEIADMAVSSGELPNLAMPYSGAAAAELGDPSEQKAFVLEYGGNVLDPAALNSLGLNSSGAVYLIPISVPAPGSATSFLEPQFGPDGQGTSEFAQITRPEDAQFTEWVRYDYVGTNDLVRDHAAARLNVYQALAGPVGGGLRSDVGEGNGGFEEPPGDGPTVPGGSIPGGGESGIFDPNAPPSAPAPASAVSSSPAAPALASGTAPSASPAQDTEFGYWRPLVGDNLDPLLPITQSVSDSLHHRGVFGTESHEQPGGALVLPVIRCALPTPQGVRPDRGWPGRFDAVFVVEGLPSDPGFPAVVQRAYQPVDRRISDWQSTGGSSAAVSGSVTTETFPENVNDFIRPDAYYVAFTEELGIPLAPGSLGDPTDARSFARLSKFPSGELPRSLTQVLLGADAGGGAPLAATVDEVVFGSAQFGGTVVNGFGGLGAAMVLASDLAPGANALRIQPDIVRTAKGIEFALPGSSMLGELPTDAGLLRIGEELILYSSIDTLNGQFEVAPLGRGAFASEVRAHAAGESVWFLFDVEVSQLISGAAGADNELVLEDTSGFPDVGTFLIEDELIHYTYRIGNALGMPRLSNEPGADDHQGPGLLRGRFGTFPSDHALGMPVVRFPVRYPDRFTPLANAPELTYAECVSTTPGSFVDRIFFEFQPPPSGLCELLCLVRSDPGVPWDSVPDETPGLRRVTLADPSSGGVELNSRTDRLELRFFAQYLPGAFDARLGLAHGWKEIPRVDQVGATYFAPGRVLTRRVH